MADLRRLRGLGAALAAPLRRIRWTPHLEGFGGGREARAGGCPETREMPMKNDHLDDLDDSCPSFEEILEQLGSGFLRSLREKR